MYGHSWKETRKGFDIQKMKVMNLSKITFFVHSYGLSMGHNYYPYFVDRLFAFDFYRHYQSAKQ